jgi:hypothetical protein
LTQDEFQQLVLNNEETIIQKIETIDITYITEDQADALFELYNCPDYNPNVAVKESESKFFHEIGRIHQKLLLDITEGK